jgi:hypothetical protein
VEALDLRSNDERLLAIKKACELKYPSRYFVSKRGENSPADGDHLLPILPVSARAASTVR